MPSLSKIILGSTVVFGLATAPASALVFEFSYAFEDGLIVTGSLTGTLNGTVIENVSDVSLVLDGIALTGPVYPLRYEAETYVLGSVVSFDALQNNFVFATSNLATDEEFFSDASFFAVVDSWPDFSPLAVARWELEEIYSTDQPPDPTRWTLTQVPESGATAAMLAFGTSALAVLPRLRGRIRAPRRAPGTAIA